MSERTAAPPGGDMRVLQSSSAGRRRVVWLLAGFAASALLAGGLLWPRSRRTPAEMQYRFVDPQLRLDGHAPAADRSGVAQLSTAAFPVGSLLDDTRYVLQGVKHAVLVFAQNVTVPTDGRVSFFPPLPEQLQGAARIALTPQFSLDQKWQPLPTAVGKTEEIEGVRRMHVVLTLPAEAAGKRVEVHVDGIAIMPERTTAYRTPPVRIPGDARLAFGMGIERPAWSQGAVLFRIKACEAGVCDLLFSERVDPSAEAGQGWLDRVVPLDSLAGSTRSFLFETELANRAPAAFSLPMWSNPTVDVARAPADRGVNVILLSIDTLAATHLPIYGYELDTTPFLQATFTKKGTIFEHCVAAATTTPPSHMTMFTSVQPSVHGLTIGLGQTLPGWLITLAETLRASGFETGAVTEDGWLGTQFGFGRGFNSYAENKSADMMSPRGQVALTFQKARAWLARNRDRRFFLFLHTFEVHDPYTPPPEYLGFFDNQNGQPITDTSPRAVRERVAYDREIRYTDDELHSLFETLEETGLSHNTIFIVVSDHGEEFFEHGYWGHGAHLYEEVTHVPLMFWGPGHVPEGKRVADPVGHIDLMPTILDIAGVPPPSQVMGTSFTDLLFDTPRRNRTEHPRFSEAWGGLAVLPDYTAIDFERPGFMVQAGTRKLSRYRKGDGFRYEYYDLATDPQERTNLYVEGQPGIADLRVRLDEYEYMARARAMNLETASQQAPEGDHTPVQLDPAQEEKLRALGYLK